MGRRREQLEILLAKRDEQIEILESRIQASTTRVSQLQTRLLSTLDTLDQVKSLQEQELVPLERENARLKAQLNRYLAVVKAAELERDDMQDAVLKLIEKVEASSDYSKWPRSQIHLSSLSASLSPPLPKPLHHNSEDNLLSYASSILASLRRERDNERKSHARTRDLAEKRILALEAQLSRREVELERCIVGGHVLTQHDVGGEGDRTPRQRVSPPAMAPSVDALEQLDNEEVISILDSTVARNRILEGEVRTLVRRLEEARASASQTSNVPNSAARPRVEDAPPNNRSDRRRSQFELLQDENNRQTRDVIEETRESIFLDHSLVDHQLLRDLDRQIRELGQKVDAFAEERRNIQQTFPSTSSEHVQTSNHSDHDRRIRELENECQRLRRSEDDLRDELDVARADAHAREEDLLERIRELELQGVRRGVRENDELLRRGNVQQPPTQIEPEPPDLLGPFGGTNDHVDDDDDGEISMELATPLMPTSVMDATIVLDEGNGGYSDFASRRETEIQRPQPHLRSPDPAPLFAGASGGGGATATQSSHVLPAHAPLYQGPPHVTIPPPEDYQYYVDPPSIPLPPSPPEIHVGNNRHHHHHPHHDDHAHDDDNDHDVVRHEQGDVEDAFQEDEEEDDDPGGDSPTLSQIALETSILEGEMSALTRRGSTSLETPQEEVHVQAFAAELHDVEVQLGEAQRAVEIGEMALEGLEGLVRELRSPP